MEARLHRLPRRRFVRRSVGAERGYWNPRSPAAADGTWGARRGQQPHRIAVSAACETVVRLHSFTHEKGDFLRRVGSGGCGKASWVSIRVVIAVFFMGLPAARRGRFLFIPIVRRLKVFLSNERKGRGVRSQVLRRGGHDLGRSAYVDGESLRFD